MYGLRWLITDKEREVLEAIIQYGTITDAALKLGISKSSASMRLARLRDRYLKAKQFIREYESYQRELPPKYL